MARFRARARQAGLTEVTIAGQVTSGSRRSTLPDSRVVRLNRLYPKSIVKAAVAYDAGAAPARPASRGGSRPRDEELLAWARKVIDTVIDPAGAQQETS